MKANKQHSLISRENELLTQFSMMTSDQIKEMMATAESTTTKIICWEYLETLKGN
jgi:hypothetical protein